MSKLEETHPNVYQMFTKGYHVVCRSERFWAGLSTGLVIEQVLMRSLKTTGGMTRERGMTELQRSVGLLSTPACAKINHSMQEVTGVKYEASDQHKETTQARLAKDFKDSVNIMKYIFARNLFDNQKELMNRGSCHSSCQCRYYTCYWNEDYYINDRKQLQIIHSRKKTQ